MWNKWKERWKVTSDRDMIIIIIVFAITGSLSVKVSRPILEFLGVKSTLAWYIYWPVRVFITLPVYQILLFCIGSIFGQYQFFSAFIMKMLKRMVGKK